MCVLHVKHTADLCCHWSLLWPISGHKGQIEGSVMAGGSLLSSFSSSNHENAIKWTLMFTVKLVFETDNTFPIFRLASFVHSEELLANRRT